jgi:exopolysaccharide biosynthesis polyprenyl glycosylphosphotransferase
MMALSLAPVILLGALYVLVPDDMAGRGLFLSSVLIGVALILPFHALRYRMHIFRQRALILGTSPLALKLIHEIEAQPHCRYAVVGVIDDVGHAGDVPSRYPVWGPLDRLDRIIAVARPQRIIVALSDRRGRLPVRQLLESRVHRGIIIEDGVEVYERLTGKLALESLGPSSLIFSKDFRKSRLALATERALSLLAAVIGLVGFAPLFGLIALAIKLDSRGPVLFVQDRVGRRGEPFKLLKFRTMRPVDGKTSEWARDNGHRITRVGKWLRRFRLDELPQLVNIVRGEMNLVGPRPHPFSNFELFTLLHRNLSDVSGQAIPYYTLRSAVRPGLTGWAQVRNGYANGLEEETEKLRYDLYYIKHRSLWLDLRILVATVGVVLRGRESAAAGRTQ